MKKIVTIILLFLGISVCAQDIITLRTGEQIRAIVTEVSQSEIRFRLYEHQEGPIRVHLASEVFVIDYQDGTREIISALDQADTSSQTTEENQNFLLRRDAKIVIATYSIGRGPRTIIQRRLMEMGFRNVQIRTDQNEATADFMIIVHPVPAVWMFRIVDRASDQTIYNKGFAHMTTAGNTVGRFIRDIAPFVE